MQATSAVSSDTVSLTPDLGKLAGKTKYTLRLAPSISDTSGRTLGSPFLWSFTTQQEVLGENAIQLAAINPAAGFRPLQASDDAGNIFVAWVATQNIGGTDYAVIQYQYYLAASAQWNATATTIQTSPLVTGQSALFSLTAVPGGEPVVMWGGSLGDGNLALFQSTLQMNSPGVVTYTTPLATPLMPDSSATTPVANAAVFTNGSLAAVGKNVNVITAALFNPQNQTWGPVQQIASDGISLPQTAGTLGFDNVAVGADSSGAVTIVYSTGAHIMATTRAANAASWPTPVQLDTLTTGTTGQFVVKGGSNGTFATWSQTVAGGTPTIQAAHLSLGSTSWTAPTHLDDGQSPTGADSPSIAMDAAGYVSVAYTQTNTGMTIAATDGLYLVRFDPTTSSWGAPARADPQGVGAPPTAPAIAVDQAGNVLLVFRVGNYQAWSQYLSSTGTIDMAPIVDYMSPETSSGVSRDATVLMGPNNEATAAWYFFGGPYQVRLDRFQ